MIFRFSSSIENFAERVEDRFDVGKWSWFSLFEPTVFFGLYHEGDWIRFLLHRGKKWAFWCGEDIIRLQKSPLWQWILSKIPGEHICENTVQYDALYKMGIHCRVHPVLFFDATDKYEVTFKPSKNPQVWMTCHPGREKEYRVDLIEEIADQVPEVTFHILGAKKPFHEAWYDNVNIGEIHNLRQATQKNIKYYGWISPQEVDDIIKKCHAGFRGNEFDGCPHAVTKSILHGQYPISRIAYPGIDSYNTTEELIKLLKGLKSKKKPNIKGREMWLKILNVYPWNL